MSQNSPLFVIQPLKNASEANVFINDYAFSLSHLNNREPRVVFLVIFLSMFGYFTQNGFKSYGHRQFWNSNTLLFHALAGLVEIALYYFQWYNQDALHPHRAGELALFLCIVQSMTNLQMVKYLRKGHPYIVRPSYQAGAFLRTITMFLAYITESPTLYTDALMPLHSFFWVRVFFSLFGSIGLDASFKENVNEEEIYTLAVFGGAVIGVGMSENIYAVTVYLGVVWTLGMLNKWTRGQLDRDEDLNLQTTGFVKMLKTIGLCNFKSSRSAACKRERINTGPPIGDLKGDSWSDPLARFGHYERKHAKL